MGEYVMSPCRQNFKYKWFPGVMVSGISRAPSDTTLLHPLTEPTRLSELAIKDCLENTSFSAESPVSQAAAITKSEPYST